MLIFSFSYSFFLFLSFRESEGVGHKIYFMEAKKYFVFRGHKKEKIFSSEKEKIVWRDLWN
jgi:hypothetical protein